MSKKIFEELPSRADNSFQYKPNPNNAENSSNVVQSADPIEKSKKRIRQAIYDIRYRARREDLSLGIALSQYLRNSKLTPQEQLSVKSKLTEDYDCSERINNSAIHALYRVFVIGEKKEIVSNQTYIDKLNENSDRKYHIRVTDGNTGKTYYRYATRDKVNKLRSNPNIRSVELLDKMDSTYGKIPYEGERKRGSQTAAVTSGKGLDYDGDGEVESGPKEYRGSVHNAIQRKKGGTPDGKDTSGVKEDFIWQEETTSTEGQNTKKISNKKVDNYKSGAIKISPEESNKMNEKYSNSLKRFQSFINTVKEEAVSQNQQQLAGMALAFLRGEMPDASEEVKKMAKMGEKELRKFAKTKHEGLPKKVKEEAECNSDDSKEEEDPRSMKTKINLVKNKLRAMGLKMSYEPEGDQIDEFFGPDKVVPKGGQISGSKDPVEVGRDYVAQSGGKPAVVNYDKAGSKTVRPFTQQDNLNRRKNTLAQNAAAASMGMSPLYNVRNSYEPEGEMVDEAKVDDDLSPLEKQNARNKRSGNSTFTRQNLTKIYRGKSTRGMKPSEPTDDLSDEEKERAREEKERARAAMTSVRKYEMALNQPNTPVGKRVRGEIEMNKAELGPSGRRGS